MDVVTGALIVLLLAMAMAAYWLISVNDPQSSGPPDSPTDSPPRNEPRLRMDQLPEWEQIVRGEKDRDKHGSREHPPST